MSEVRVYIWASWLTQLQVLTRRIGSPCRLVWKLDGLRFGVWMCLSGKGNLGTTVDDDR